MTHSRFSEKSYWSKLSRFALSAGREAVEKSLFLYYAAQRPETPKWAKTAMYGALAYFIAPVDTMPDFLPMLGFTDDLAVMAAAITMVSFYINDEVKAKARNKLNAWFGEKQGTTYEGTAERPESARTQG
ncbi:DUF1232 domain-containing protein [Pseudomonas sp. gcc21]|uniref:YkvA family protein n=1 Tax=Pseudomonas sp. gcc21 TaxID=2726989 RepID=UPI0014528825|nr:YkvA family protein [Pseudomonas sp. gcc21]QJD58335.1 DUF1232 domain-containing protein [Pseudomonas sp. gcc21]